MKKKTKRGRRSKTKKSGRRLKTKKSGRRLKTKKSGRRSTTKKRTKSKPRSQEEEFMFWQRMRRKVDPHHMRYLNPRSKRKTARNRLDFREYSRTAAVNPFSGTQAESKRLDKLINKMHRAAVKRGTYMAYGHDKRDLTKKERADYERLLKKVVITRSLRKAGTGTPLPMTGKEFYRRAKKRGYNPKKPKRNAGRKRRRNSPGKITLVGSGGIRQFRDNPKKKPKRKARKKARKEPETYMTKGYAHKVLMPDWKRKIDPRSVRTKTIRTKRGGKRLIRVGCPKGQWMPSKQKCKVGTQAISIMTPKEEKILKALPRSMGALFAAGNPDRLAVGGKTPPMLFPLGKRSVSRNPDRVIARWQSRSGKHWVELKKDEYGYHYDAPGASGVLGNITEEEAIRQMEQRVPYMQPDKAKTPMRRVKNPNGGTAGNSGTLVTVEPRYGGPDYAQFKGYMLVAAGMPIGRILMDHDITFGSRKQASEWWRRNKGRLEPRIKNAISSSRSGNPILGRGRTRSA